MTSRSYRVAPRKPLYSSREINHKVIGVNPASLKIKQVRKLLAIIFSLGLVSLPDARAADIVSDAFGGAAQAPILDRTPDTTNAPGGKWSMVHFDLGGGFTAFIGTAAGSPANRACLSCAGNSTGAIAIPLSSQGAYSKPQRFTISANLSGTTPGLGFYSALPVQDPDGVFDVFSNFTGLQLQDNGTLVFYRKGSIVSSVPATGTFDAKDTHNLSYDVDTATGAISHVSLQGSTSDYSSFTIPGAFTDAATTYAAVAALCEGGRDNQAYVDHFLVAESSTPPATSAAQAINPPMAGHPAILIKSGEKIGFMGDSITALGNSPQGYVQLVIRGLKEEGVDATGIPAGHSGDTSGNMLVRTNPDVLHKGADWMTLSCGVNDVAGQAHGFGCDLESFKKNVAGMVAKARGWNVRVILFTATPLGEDAANASNQKLAAYNDFLRGFAKEKNLPLADMNAAFWAVLNSPAPDGTIPGKRLLADGIHPNETGQFLMTTTLLQTLGVPAADMPRVERALKETPPAP